MKISQEDLLSAIEENTFGLSNWGFCVACGNQQDGCEPDAANYTCEACNVRQVFGAEEILLRGLYEE